MRGEEELGQLIEETAFPLAVLSLKAPLCREQMVFPVRSSSPERVTLVEDEEHDQSPVQKYQFDWKCALPVTTMSLIPTLSYEGESLLLY